MHYKLSALKIPNFLRGIFYERDREGNHWYTIGHGDLDWDLGDPLDALLGNPVTFACADLYANIFSQVEFGIGDKTPEESKDDPIIKLLNKPNYFQSKQDFLKEHIFLKLSYGWVYQRPLASVGFMDEPTAIYNLNPKGVTYDKTFRTRLLFATKDINQFKKYQFRYNDTGETSEFSIEDVIPLFDIANGLTDDFLLKAPSRLKSVRKPMKNIDMAMKSENKSLSKAGRFIVSGSQQGQGITRPMDPEEKRQIEQNFGRYGNNRMNGDIIATNSHVNVHSLHIPVAQLGLPESQANNAMTIINAFRVPRELYTLDKSGATYENQKQALITFVQNVIQPEADDFANSHTNYFGKEDEPIKAYFDHLSVMQYIEEMKADRALKISTAIKNLAGTEIDPMEFLESVGINIESDGKR